MNDYSNDSIDTARSGAAIAIVAILFILLLVGGLALGGYFFFQVKRKEMAAHQAALRAEAIALRQQAEVMQTRGQAETARLEAEKEVEATARQEAEAARSVAEDARLEAAKAKEELERLRSQLDELKSQADSDAPPDAEIVQLTVYLSEDGEVYVDQEPKDWEQLTKILDDLGAAARARVVIVAEPDCRMEPVLRLMQLAKRRELSVTVSAREFGETTAN